MSERYEINYDGTDMAGNDEYVVFDTDMNRPVYTNSGDVYTALRENAQWTADRLNRAEARKLVPLKAAVAEVLPEPEPKPEPVVRPVQKVDYPGMAGKAIGSIGVLSGRLKSIGRWLDALEDGSVSSEFALAKLREVQSESWQYAERVYEELNQY